MKNYPYTLPSAYQGYVEVVDEDDKPIMILPQKQVFQQGLAHRKVYTVLQDLNERTLLLKSSKNHVLSIPNTHVYAGEAGELASLRVLKRIFNPKEDLPITLQPHVISNYKYITFFTSIIHDEYKKHFDEKVLWLDFVEMQGFINHFSDMLNHELLEFINHGYLEQLYKLNYYNMNAY